MKDEDKLVSTYYRKDGTKLSEGNKKDGKQDGLWTYYHENGNIKGKGNFLSGDGGNVSEVSGIPRNGRNGIRKFFYEEGQKDLEGTYKNGKRDGQWTKWYENGKKESEGTFKDGKEDGLFNVWY